MLGLGKLFREAPTCLRKSIDLMLFMEPGIRPFENADKYMFLRSFWWTVFFIPITFWSVTVIQPLGAEETDKFLLGLTGALSGLAALLFGMLLLYGFAKYVDRMQGFFTMVTAANWVGVLMTLLAIIFVSLIGSSDMERKTAEDVLIVFQIYGYAVTGYIAYRSFNIPWQLAAFVAILMLFANETSHDIVYMIADVPVVDYSEVFE